MDDLERLDYDAIVRELSELGRDIRVDGPRDGIWTVVAFGKASRTDAGAITETGSSKLEAARKLLASVRAAN